MNQDCPSCGSFYNITTEHIGRSFKCNKCGAKLKIEDGGLILKSAGSSNRQEPPDDVEIVDGSTARLVDYLTFRRMIVPLIIQVLFWVGVALSILAGVIELTQVLTSKDGRAWDLISAVFFIVVGPLVVRIYCELLIVIFRINETLTDIKSALERDRR